MKIKIGPSGLGSVKDSIKILEEYHRLGLTACEIAFTYSNYIKNEKDAKEIRDKAKELGIDLSIHGSYFINLNSPEKEKVEASKKRIISALKIGTWLKAKRVVFHPGFYGKRTPEETYENIKNEILELQKIRKENKYTPKIAPEIMGKINVFGSIDEIAQLVTDTKCSFCIDFAHILARYKNYNFEKTKKAFKNEKSWHIHFSGIEYGEKGERRHIMLENKEIKKLFENLPKNKELTIICESPNPVKDAIKIKEFSKVTLRRDK